MQLMKNKIMKEYKHTRYFKNRGHASTEDVEGQIIFAVGIRT